VGTYNPTGAVFTPKKASLYYTSGYIAKLTGVSPATVNNWEKSGQLKCMRLPPRRVDPDTRKPYKIGGRRFRREDVVEFLNKVGMEIPEELRGEVPGLEVLGVCLSSTIPNVTDVSPIYLGLRLSRCNRDNVPAVLVFGTLWGIDAASQMAAECYKLRPQARRVLILPDDRPITDAPGKGFSMVMSEHRAAADLQPYIERTFREEDQGRRGGAERGPNLPLHPTPDMEPEKTVGRLGHAEPE
jgi:hypothetical protein